MKVLEREVIVVGAGPAGAVCSAYLVRQGIDVLLLDRETFPREKVCGDGQDIVSCLTLKELGWLDGMYDIGHLIKGVKFTSPKYEVGIMTPPDPTLVQFCTPRRVFDHYLVKCAVKDGVELMEDCWVYDVIWEDGTVKGVKAKYQGEPIEIHAKLVIGADGAHSIVAQKIDMFADEDYYSVVGGRCYFEDVDIEPYFEVHFDEEVLPGYVWVFAQKNKVANVGLGFSRSFYPYKKEHPETLQEILQRWIYKSPHGAPLRGKKMIGEFRGWRLPLGPQAKENFVPGCMLIGDAGSMILPLSGEGMAPAMITAKFAAEIAKEALDKNDVSANVLSQYPQRRDDFYREKYQAIQELKNNFANADAINKMVHGINTDPAALDQIRSQWYFDKRI